MLLYRFFIIKLKKSFFSRFIFYEDSKDVVTSKKLRFVNTKNLDKIMHSRKMEKLTYLNFSHVQGLPYANKKLKLE